MKTTRDGWWCGLVFLESVAFSHNKQKQNIDKAEVFFFDVFMGWFSTWGQSNTIVSSSYSGTDVLHGRALRNPEEKDLHCRVERNRVRIAAFRLQAKPFFFRITSRWHLVQIMEKKINNHIWKLSNNQPFLHPAPPRVSLGKPSHTSSGVSEQAADAKSAAAATHKRVYLAEERRRRLCRPIFTVTLSTVWDCDCNSLNTWMGGGGGEGFMGKNCSFISWLLSNSQPSPRASDYQMETRAKGEESSSAAASKTCVGNAVKMWLE